MNVIRIERSWGRARDNVGRKRSGATGIERRRTFLIPARGTGAQSVAGASFSTHEKVDELLDSRFRACEEIPNGGARSFSRLLSGAPDEELAEEEIPPRKGFIQDGSAAKPVLNSQ